VYGVRGMDDVARVLQRACEVLDALAGPIVTILMIALTFGLVCLAAGLTVLVLWKSFSFGFRFTVLKAWVKATDYLTRYFNRLRKYGLTRVASRVAVFCGLIVWVAIVLGFAFDERLVEALILALLVLPTFFVWGWSKRGPRAQFLKFSRGFLEPTIALAVPTFIAKSSDFVFKLVVSTIKTVL
jgi:hypothetical protein